MTQQTLTEPRTSSPQWLHTRTDAWKAIQLQEAEARLEVVDQIQQANTRHARRVAALFVAFVFLLGAGLWVSSQSLKTSPGLGETMKPATNIAVSTPVGQH